MSDANTNANQLPLQIIIFLTLDGVLTTTRGGRGVLASIFIIQDGILNSTKGIHGVTIKMNAGTNGTIVSVQKIITSTVIAAAPNIPHMMMQLMAPAIAIPVGIFKTSGRRYINSLPYRISG